MKNIFKNLLIALCFMISLSNITFADEIIQSDGVAVPCRIETVVDGFVEYYKNGVLYSFARETSSPIFNDYIVVKNKVFTRKNTTKYYGKVLIKNMWNTVLRLNDGTSMNIPFYRVKFIGIYKP